MGSGGGEGEDWTVTPRWGLLPSPASLWLEEGSRLRVARRGPDYPKEDQVGSGGLSWGRRGNGRMGGSACRRETG